MPAVGNGPRGYGHIGINAHGYLIYKFRENFIIYQESVHRIVAMFAVKRKLPTSTQVHHINRNRLDPMPSNLIICPSVTIHAEVEMISFLKAKGYTVSDPQASEIIHVKDLLNDSTTIISEAIEWWLTIAPKWYKGREV